MFKDLKEYQEITQIYHDSVNISEEQRAINKIFIEEGFTSEEIEWLEENFDELWENELAQYTQECIVESFEGQDLTEEQVQQLDEVLGLGLAAKGIMKAAPIVSKGLRKANVGIKKGIRAVGRKIGGATKAVKTGVKDTARGAVSLGKSALKKVGGAIKKAAPIIGTGALLGTGAALPVAAGYGVYKGIKALRNRGKAEREAKAGDAGSKAAEGGIKGGDKSAPAGPKIGDAADKGAQQIKKLKDAGDAADKGAQQIKKTKVKPMSKIEFQNRKRFGDKAIDQKKAMNVDFQGMKKGKMTKQEFIDKYPKSQTAKKYYQSDKGYRDYKKSLKKEDIEHLDAYDMVLEYLFATEQVTTLEEANYVMMEMDQQTVGQIVTEVKQELHELLPLAGLALGGLAVNALRKRGKAKRMGKAAGKAAAMGAAGTAAGKGGSMVASVPKKKPGGAAGKAARSMLSGAAAGALGGAMSGAAGKSAGGGAARKVGGGTGAMSSAAGRASAPKIGGKPFPKERVAGRDAGRSASSMQRGTGKKSGIDLSGKTKAQIMALKRLGKI